MEGGLAGDRNYDAGAPSVAWLTWHVGFWWSVVLNHSFGDATLDRYQVVWPGPDRVVAWLQELHEHWLAATDGLNDADLHLAHRVAWPMTSRPFADLSAWLDVEFMKNASEIGFARFLCNATP